MSVAIQQPEKRVASRQGESRVVLSNVSWATFEALLADTDDRGGTRFAYDQGVLEIMSPSPEHEWITRLIGRMIEAMTEELGIPIRSARSTTLKSQLKRRGIEADECYYVANEERVRGRRVLDLKTDPPPDLAVEVDITVSSVNKLEIYGALGVPEVWLCDGAEIAVYQLQADGGYSRQPRSPSFPFLPMDHVERFLEESSASDETTWIRRFRSWVGSLKQQP